MDRTSWMYVVFVAASWHSAAAQEGAVVELFRSGVGDYELYRIPALVATNDGTLIAWCEARRTARGDWGPIDLLQRRSVDRGDTWSDAQKIASVPGPHHKNPVAVAQKLAVDGTQTYNNPVLIADPVRGVVHALFCLEYMRCFYQSSADDGVTWSSPCELTTTFHAFREHYDWKVLATGPGHGLLMNSGRLVVPVWLSTGTGGHAHRPSVIATIVSDDGGVSWQAGDIIGGPDEPLVNPSESVAVQLTDGRVMLNIRSESQSNRRAVAFSPNGATDWTAPQFDDELFEPICMGSLLALPPSAEHANGVLLFVNPTHTERGGKPGLPGQSRDRRNLTMRLSFDEGTTWPVARTIEAGRSAYSDLALLPDGTIGCLYERTLTPATAQSDAALLVFTRLQLE